MFFLSLQIVKIVCFVIKIVTCKRYTQVVILHLYNLINIMVKVSCPLEGCDFQTEDVDSSVVVVLLQIHATSHSSANQSTTKGPKLDRPRIDMGADEEAWNTFLRRWNNFRIGSNIGDSIASVQLLQCAGDDLSEMLLKADSGLTGRPISEVLSAMKSFAVIPVAKGIVRAELMQMHQANDESFRAFAARVRGKAETCGFSLTATCPCPCANQFSIDYTLEVIRDVLLAGVGNSDIKQEVLSADGVHEKSINELVAFVEKREMARSAMMRRPSASIAYVRNADPPAGSGSSLVVGTTDSSGTAATVQSTFKRLKAQPIHHHQAVPRGDNKPVPCPACGEQFHPFRKLRSGWNKTPFKECLNCWRAGRRRMQSSVKAQNADCAIAQAPPSVARVSAYEGDDQSQCNPNSFSGNVYLS